jgi:hypothetical protein
MPRLGFHLVDTKDVDVTDIAFQAQWKAGRKCNITTSIAHAFAQDSSTPFLQLGIQGYF